MSAADIQPTDGQLESSGDLNENRAKRCGWLVVAGLVLETGLTAIFPAHEPKAPNVWLALIETWGPVFADALVALGVYGEIFFFGRARRIDSELRRRSNKSLKDAIDRLAQVEFDNGYLKESAAKAEDRAAQTSLVAEQLRSENLTLQRVMMARHVGLFGIDQEPPAKQWFADCAKLPGIKILIQVIPGDPEAQNLANEIAIVLASCGWRPEMIDERRSGISLNLYEGLSVYSPASHKAWDAQDPLQLTFAVLGAAARALAQALTRAGLGIGDNPVSGVNGLIIVVDFPPEAARQQYGKFNPLLDGVYLQVGSRPVSLTLQWMAACTERVIG